MVAVIIVFVALIAVKTGMFPVPLAAKPIDALLFVQEKVDPLGDPVKVITDVEDALHTTTPDGCVTVAVGFTTILYVKEAPGQFVPPVVVAVAI